MCGATNIQSNQACILQYYKSLSNTLAKPDTPLIQLDCTTKNLCRVKCLADSACRYCESWWEYALSGMPRRLATYSMIVEGVRFESNGSTLHYCKNSAKISYSDRNVPWPKRPDRIGQAETAQTEMTQTETAQTETARPKSPVPVECAVSEKSLRNTDLDQGFSILFVLRCHFKNVVLGDPWWII